MLSLEATESKALQMISRNRLSEPFKRGLYKKVYGRSLAFRNAVPFRGDETG